MSWEQCPCGRWFCGADALCPDCLVAIPQPAAQEKGEPATAPTVRAHGHTSVDEAGRAEYT